MTAPQRHPRQSRPVVVVGIGADGWDGLARASQEALGRADVVIGSRRQLALLPGLDAEQLVWPSPMLSALPGLFDTHGRREVCVLASGDPMFHGIGTTLVRVLGRDRVRVLPHPSSASLACARMGWPLDRVTVRSLVHRPVTTLVPDLTDGAQLLVLSQDAGTVAEVVALLDGHGFGPSEVSVLSQLGGPAEARQDGRAQSWAHPDPDPLNVVAVRCHAGPDVLRATRTPGLADESYTGDGQMTKSEVRALTLSALAPAPGELLWDVGGGSGTIAIEWMRADPRCRAVTFERDPLRQAQIGVNAAHLGVPALTVAGTAPGAFTDHPTPDAVFVGGGLTQPGLLDACWGALPVGGRLVVNAVTAESEAVALAWFARHGGALRRFQVHRGEPLGGFTTWRPQLPVTQWSVRKAAGSKTGAQS